jgi:glycosyl transferase, family 25
VEGSLDEEEPSPALPELPLKIYVINLKDSTKRRKLMERQLQRLRLEYEIVDGINGHHLDDEQLSACCDLESLRKHPDWLTPGAVGAALSHRLVWTHIARSSCQSALVVEDDVLLPDHLPQILNQIECHYQGNELILLYWLSNVVQTFHRQSAVRIDESLLLARSINPASLLSAVMYVIDSDVASRMIDINSRIKVTADHWACHLDGHSFSQIRCLVPSPVKLANYPSDIRYGNQNILKRVKRSLESKCWLIHQFSANRRQRYFDQRQLHDWV